MKQTYTVTLDLEGANWLADEAESLFYKTKDYGWDEIARDLRSQIKRNEQEDA